ncbi:DUF1799 domain-containing protein [Vreelandella neptunia]|uniref:DUF1799 domain-containing protein n=1 Tax=Vreelandella neptunia TaxID=115551 RepID=UPI00315A5718
MFEVWEEHWPALELFLAMRTQWRTAIGMGGGQRLGIDYTSLYGHPKFARLDYEEQDKLLGQIQYIEAGALAAFNEQSHLAEQEAEQQAQVTEIIEKRAELCFLQEEQQRINVRELMNVMDLPADYRGDGAFLA